MNSAHHDKKAVVIGAGLGGLATACRLAHRGWSVTVLERASQPGGKMNRLKRDGFTFDTGPSLVTMPWVFESFFRDVGCELRDHIELMPVHPLARYYFEDTAPFDYSTQLPEWLDTVEEIEPNGAEHFLRFMTLGARLYELSRHTFFKQSPRENPSLKDWRALKYLPRRHGFSNYQRVINRFFRSPQLRQLFGRYATFVGSSPWRIPSTLSVIPYAEYAFGAWHIRGGLYRLIESIIHNLEQHRAEIHLNTSVGRILHESSRITGVETEAGAQYPADVVVMNGDAATTPGLLDGTRTALPQDRRSMSGLVFLLGLNRRLEHVPHHSVYFSSDYRREFDDLFRHRRFPEEPTVYVNLPGRTDPEMSPPGGETMFVMANAPANDGEAWDATAVETARDKVYRRLARFGFPEFEKQIIVSEVITPCHFAEQYGMPGGALYGAHSHGYRNAFLRPPNRNRRVSGLYHVGGSTHPGGGTPTVLLSSAITTNLIEEYHG